MNKAISFFFCSVIFLFSFSQPAYAAFPIAHPNFDSTRKPAKHAPVAGTEKIKKPIKKPFSTLSGYGFLLICASVPVVAFISYETGWFDYVTEWLAVASFITGLSIISASLGIVFGEGIKARIMLFLSVFFFLVLLLFR